MLNTRPLIESANGDDCVFIPNLARLSFRFYFHQSKYSNGRLPVVFYAITVMFVISMHSFLFIFCNNNHESYSYGYCFDIACAREMADEMYMLFCKSLCECGIYDAGS